MREPLNSTSLYQKNKEIYKNFFSQYPLVISSPGGVILAGAFSHQFGGIGIHQRIPLRNLIGIRKTNKSNEIEVEFHSTYDTFEKAFLPQKIDHDIKGKIDYLKNKLKENNIRFGLKIGLLNEIPRRCGLNNPGVNAANLAMVFLYLTGKVNQKILNDFENNCLDQENKDLIIQTVKEFHQVFIGPNNSGFGALSCFFNTSFPIVYQTKNDIVIRALNEIFPNSSKSSPFDITIIGTSDRSEIDFTLSKYDHISESVAVDQNYLDKIRAADFQIEDKKTEKFCVLDSYRQAINASSISCLSSLGESFENANTEKLNACLESFNNAFNSLNLVGSNFKRKNKVADFIKYYFDKNLPDTPYALTTSIANNLILLTIREHMKPHLRNLKKFLDESLDFEISWPYVSWIDENDDKGLKIEQSYLENIYCDKLPQNSLILKELDKLEDTIDTNSINSKEEVIGQFDLLLDGDDKKIYIGKKKIDSKSLPTSARTIELLDLLFSSEEMSLKNNKLPDISYFADRNELQSKIISPLKILIESELSVILNLKISGTITDFSVSLFPSNIKIGLIKRT